MQFTLNKPIITTEPQVVVDAGLPIGSHRFRLEVEDDSDNVSLPAEIVVTITRASIIGDPVAGPI